MSVPDPIHYWSFNDASTSATMDSRGGLRASVVTSTDRWRVPGKWKNGMRFGKSTGASAVDIKRTDGKAPDDLIHPWSVAVWVMRHAGADGGATLLCSDRFAIKIEQWGEGGRLGLTGRFQGPGISVLGDQHIDKSLPIGQWSHLVVVGTDVGTTFYVDGFAEGVLPAIPAPLAFLGSTRGSGAPEEVAEATIEELRIYNVALTPEQVKELGGFVPTDDPKPVTALPFEKLPLQVVLDTVNANVAELTKHIPFPWSITYDVNTEGNAITDGGTDMYDVGNILCTEIDTLTYSNNLVRKYGGVGPKGAYFTLLMRQMFVAVADLDGVQRFGTRGGLGADGGSVDGTVLTATVDGATYKGFVKRVYGTSDPSVNHLFIVRDDAGAVKHDFPNDVALDEHRLTGLPASGRVYYLMFGTRDRRNGVQVAHDVFQKLMEALFTLLKAKAAQGA